ncbi:hypothetical protein Tco_0662085 [Tanacetum coccineum]
MVVSTTEDEETKNQGRKIQYIDDDPLVSLVRESMKEKYIDFVTPTKISALGEEEELSNNKSKEKLSSREAGFFFISIQKKIGIPSEQNLKQCRPREKKFYAEQKDKKPIKEQANDKAHQIDYMVTFHQESKSSWKLTQLKKLTFDELKTEFEKLVKSIEKLCANGELMKEKKKLRSLKRRRGKTEAKGKKEYILTRLHILESEEEREAFMKDKVTSASSESEIGIDAK